MGFHVFEMENTTLCCFFHRNNDETFYCLNRKQLEEYQQCVIAEQQAFCPDKCGFCEICKEFDQIYDCLKRSF